MRDLKIVVSLLATLAAAPLAAADCRTPVTGVSVCQEPYGSYFVVHRDTPVGQYGASAGQFAVGDESSVLAGAYAYGNAAGNTWASATLMDFDGDGAYDFTFVGVFSDQANAYVFDFEGNTYACSSPTGCTHLP